MLFNQLVDYNLHIGHKSKNTTLLASWMLFKSVNNLWFINLYKTIWFFKLILNFIRILVYKNSPIWFINSEMAKQYIINRSAIDCGEFYCGFIWKRGLLSNYISMLRVIKKLISRKFTNINSDFYYFFKTWYLTRLSWPRAVYVSNLKLYNVISKEAFTAHVPVIGLIDTNIKNYYINFPIPSNDDSLISLTFVSLIISKYILLFKYKKVILWYIYYKGSKKYKGIFNIMNSLKKILNFEKIKKMEKSKFKFLHFNRFNFFKNLKFCISFLFKKKKRIYNYSKQKLVDTRFNIGDKYIFFFNVIQLEILRKHKTFLSKYRSLKLNRKFYRYNFFNLELKLSKSKFAEYKWYYFYFYLNFIRLINIIVCTYRIRNLKTLSSISFFYKSSIYQYKKNKLYSKRNNTWLNFQKYYSLLKHYDFDHNKYKSFPSKLKIYKFLLNEEFKDKILKLDSRPKYITTRVFAPFESFRNRYAKVNWIKNMDSFAINLKKLKNLDKILEKELYLTLLIQFINMNMKIRIHD